MTLVPTDQLLQLRRIGLDPTIDSRVVNVNAALPPSSPRVADN